MPNSKTNYILGSLFVIATLIGAPVWTTYLQGGFLFYFTLVLAPFILYVRYPNVASYRFALAAILSICGHLYLGINILYLAAYLFFLLYLVEIKWGKLNDLSIYWIFILSPLTVYLFSVFSFPIRLKLSELATNILAIFYPNTSSQGNMIVLHGIDFSVDEACMGLKMVSYSYLAFLILISYFEKKEKKALSKPKIVFLLSLGTAFILLANLIRIIAVILFEAMPNTLAHDLVGIACWLLYVILPSFYLIKYAVRNWAQTWPTLAPKQLSSNWTSISIIIIILLLSAGSYLKFHQDPTPPIAKVNITLPHFEKSIGLDGIVQLKHPNVLIYIKPSCAPYKANHAPNICWKGSGYAFKNEQVARIANVPVITAELIKEGDQLYTAWWYDNGIIQTNSQVTWRWESMKGNGRFQLINVTADSPELLNSYIQILTTKQQ